MNKILVNNNDSLIKVPDGSNIFIFDNSPNSLKVEIGLGCLVNYVAILDKDCERNIYVGNNSELNISSLYQFSGQFKINNFIGREVILNSQVLSYLKNDQNLQVEDNYIFTDELSSGKININSLADDSSVINYSSDVVIKPVATHTETRIDMKLHLLSPQAKGFMLPGLKIATNQVKAGHGASTSQLTLEDLFYLSARGLNSDQAKKLIKETVVRQFINSISDEETKIIISNLIKL